MAQLPPILIVDDDADDVFILRRLLVKAGVKNKTVSFEDPVAAVMHLTAVIRSGETLFIPCATFTDLNMRGMSGIKFTQWARSQSALASMRIVMVSSSENPKDQAAAIAAGADRYFVKYPAASALERLVAEFKC